jgi:hypothetical protein
MRAFFVAVFVGSLALGGCAGQDVWVKPGATVGDFEVSKGRCLAGAYSQVPAAQTVASFGTGYQAPLVTNCSAFGAFVNCTTTGGQYTPPPSFSYDANAGVRSQVFKGCMYSDGWSLEKQSTEVANYTPPANIRAPIADSETDWAKGYRIGRTEHHCDTAGKSDDWVQACRSALGVKPHQASLPEPDTH